MKADDPPIEIHPSSGLPYFPVRPNFRCTTAEVVDSAVLPLRTVLRVWRLPNLLQIAAGAAGPLPVPGTFVFSRNNGIVAWEGCVEPAQPEDCFETPGSHVAPTRDFHVLEVLARRLARVVP